MAAKRDPIIESSVDFSLVLGGPLYQLYLRTRMARPSMELLGRRLIAFILLTWFPLLVLSAVSRQAIGGGIQVPFFYDVEVHVRFLIALPLLLIMELVAHQRIQPVIRQFISNGIVQEESLPKFESIIGSAIRLRNSVTAEVLLILFVLTAGHYLWSTWSSQVTLKTATWYATMADSEAHFTLAGYWYAYVSMPVFQFILLRWMFRWFVWLRFLWHISRMDLNLMPTHPDGAGGLGFLDQSARAFIPFVMAEGALLAGMIANRIFFTGASLVSFKPEIAASIVFSLFFVLGPLSVFSSRLIECKRKGLREYRILASQYVRRFDGKWIQGPAPVGEPLLGSADIQSLADLGNSFEIIQKMKMVPFGKDGIVQIIVASALPLLPLGLTMFSLEELIKNLLSILL
jgi:hypothetical protein